MHVVVRATSLGWRVLMGVLDTLGTLRLRCRYRK